MKTREDETKIPSFDDMVFEGRNKAYGAYSIRKKYNSTLLWAIFIGVFIAGSAVVTPYVKASLNPGVIVIDNGPIYEPSEVTTIPDEPETPPVAEQPKVSIPKEVFTTPEVVDSIVDENSPRLLTAEEAADLPDEPSTIEIDNKPKVEIDEPIPVSKEEAEWIVDEDPVFGNGDKNEFQVWVLKNLKYPEEAEINGVQGRVFVQFVIEKDGSISNVRVAKPGDPLLDQEAIRVIQSSPCWTPAKKQGRVVRKWITFPITFKLNQQ